MSTDLATITTPTLVPSDLDARLRFVSALAEAGSLPPAFRKRPADLLLVASYADDLGLGMASALSSLFVVDGKVTLSASLVASLVRRAGHRLRTTTAHDDEGAPTITATIVRADDPEWSAVAVWDLPRAQRAGLAGRDSWRKYPEQMLRARAVTEAAREACPEVLSGLYLADEVSDAPARSDDALTSAVERTHGRPAPTSWDAPPASPLVASGGLHGRAPSDAGQVGSPDSVQGAGEPTVAERRHPLTTPTDKQLRAWNARLRARGCRDETQRGWATAALLDLPDYVAHLSDLDRHQLSTLLDLPVELLDAALLAVVDLGHPEDDEPLEAVLEDIDPEDLAELLEPDEPDDDGAA
jgi:hypothetical protein